MNVPPSHAYGTPIWDIAAATIRGCNPDPAGKVAPVVSAYLAAPAMIRVT